MILKDTTIDWLIWRPIVRGLATLEEIETHWDLCDVLDANEALDIVDELEQLQINRDKATSNPRNEGWR